MQRIPDGLAELVLVDETDPAAARRIRRLATAGRLRRLYPGVYTANLDSPPEAIVLRFAGIYGPDRLLRKQALLKGEPLVGDCEKWLNLIHVADGVDAILAAEAKGPLGATFNIADGEPVSRRDFYTHWARMLDAPLAQFEHRAEPGAANRRIANRAARERLGWVPGHPSYRVGLEGLG